MGLQWVGWTFGFDFDSWSWLWLWLWLLLSLWVWWMRCAGIQIAKDSGKQKQKTQKSKKKTKKKKNYNARTFCSEPDKRPLQFFIREPQHQRLLVPAPAATLVHTRTTPPTGCRVVTAPVVSAPVVVSPIPIPIPVSVVSVSARIVPRTLRTRGGFNQRHRQQRVVGHGRDGNVPVAITVTVAIAIIGA